MRFTRDTWRCRRRCKKSFRFKTAAGRPAAVFLSLQQKRDDRGLVFAFSGAHGSDYAKASTDRVKRSTKSQTRFSQIDVLLDAAQDFVVDDFFIAEFQDRIAFLF
jgi:hypothetical protein